MHTKRRGEDSGARGEDRRNKGGLARRAGRRPIWSEPFLYPALFAALPVVSLMARNIEVIAPDTAIRPLLVEVAFAAVAVFSLWGLLKHRELAAITTTVFLVLFNLYGHVVLTIQFALSRVSLSPHVFVAPLWVAFFGFVVWASARGRERLRNFTGIMNAAAAVALAIPLVRIIAHEAQVDQPWGEQAPLPALARPPMEGQFPDIYYIILDGYGRQDVLSANLGLDNSDFISSLEDDGFFVANQARSNYAVTVVSLASSLNMEYLDSVAASTGRDSYDVKPLTRMVRHSQVRKILESLGYKTVAFTTGYRRTEITDADVFLRAPAIGLNTLESLLVQTSALLPFYDLAHAMSIPIPYPGYLADRTRILFTLRELERLPSVEGPKFVFAHLVIPHPPFAFDADGQPFVQDHFYELADASDYRGDPAGYIQGYSGQVAFLDRKMEEVVEKIITNSQAPPIIIIQGDHGPGSHLDWSNPSDSALRERMSILNAYLFPGLEATGLYNSITPVNSFRLVLNDYFGAGIPLLPDVSYFSSAERPYHFQVVPNELVVGPSRDPAGKRHDPSRGASSIATNPHQGTE